MSSGFVIVREVAPKNLPQVGLAQYDDMIEALATDTAVQPLNVRILPWRSWCRDDFLDTHVFDALPEELAVDRVTIAKQESRGVILGKRLDDLLSGPLGRRMRSCVEVNDHAAVMAEYDETEQDAKRRCWYREEVDRNDIANVVVQEGPPSLRRRLVMADFVLVHSSL